MLKGYDTGIDRFVLQPYLLPEHVASRAVQP
jgi:hypothetical protein